MRRRTVTPARGVPATTRRGDVGLQPSASSSCSCIHFLGVESGEPMWVQCDASVVWPM